MIVQLIAVLILTPVYVAGSVADEKVRKTLEFLLATDLRNREIVLSKLGARLANLTLFVLTGLPILSLIQFLGGVDPNLVLAGFAATGMTMAGLAGFSILNSVSFKRPRDAITMTYLGAIAYLVLSFYLTALQAGGWSFLTQPIWFGSAPPTLSDVVDVFNTGNIFLMFAQVARAGRAGALSGVVPTLLAQYAAFHGVAFLLCTGSAVLRLRRVALRQLYGQTRKRSVAARVWGRPHIGEPMLWKEIFVEGGLRFNLLASFIVALLVIVSLLPGFGILIRWLTEPNLGNQWGGMWNLQREMNIYVRMAGMGVACLLLLAVAVRASTSVSSERDRQTFDALLTTPMDSTTMLWAKWVGSILSIRLGWIWLGIIYALGVVTGGLHIFALPLVMAAWLIFAGVVAMIGLWYSLVSRSTMRSTIWTLFTAVGLSVGHWIIWLLCLPLMFAGGPRSGVEEVAKFQAGITPPAALFVLAFTGEDFRQDPGRNEMVEMIFFCLFGTVLWALGGLAFWYGALSPRFRTVTGRQDFREPEGRQPRSQRRPHRSLPPRPVEVAPKNVILLEETWDRPRPRKRPPRNDGTD